jgi:hypothetical protein
MWGDDITLPLDDGAIVSRAQFIRVNTFGSLGRAAGPNVPGAGLVSITVTAGCCVPRGEGYVIRRNKRIAEEYYRVARRERRGRMGIPGQTGQAMPV